MYFNTQLNASKKPSYLIDEVITHGFLYLKLDNQFVDAIKKKTASGCQSSRKCQHIQ